MEKDWAKELATNFALQVAVVAATILLYVLTKHPIFGVLVAIEIIGIVIIEVRLGVKKHGWKGELKDIAISLGAIVIIWLGMMFVLNTPVPLDAVVSCSMLPNIERGDMVVVQGAEPLGYYIEMTPAEFEALNGPAVVTLPNGGEAEVLGSLYSYCSQVQDEACVEFVEGPEGFSEKRGPLEMHYSSCQRTYGEYYIEVPCVSSVTFKGKDYPINYSHDTIVYQPAEGTLYSLAGDIIHRLYFVVDVDGEKYYLTKGDNNPQFDIQDYSYGYGMGNTPPGKEQYKGKVIARIPYVGYLKLFISGFFSETPFCDSYLVVA